MIKLCIFSVLFLAFITFSSYNIGIFCLEKANVKWNKYLQILIGFIAIIAMFQIAFYPAMWLQLSSGYLIITGSILFALMLIYDLYHIKRVKDLLTDKWFWVCLLVAFILFVTYMKITPHNYWYFDDSFYLPHIYENAFTDRILSVEARSGFAVDKISNLYSYQGYYLFGSYLVGIMSIINEVIPIHFPYLSVVYYFLSAITFIMLTMSMIGLMIEITKEKKKRVFFLGLFIIYTIFLPISANLLNTVYVNGYTGIFALASVIVPLMIYCVFQYIKKEHNYSKILMLIFFTMLSYASFSMFLILITIYTLLAIQLWKKEKIDLDGFILMSIPLMSYIVSFILHPWNIGIIIGQCILAIIYVLYYVFRNRLQTFEKPISYLCRVVVIAFPFIAVVVSIILAYVNGSVTSITQYATELANAILPVFGEIDKHYAWIISTLFYITTLFLFGYLLYHQIRRKNNLVLWILIITLVFFNPLTINFIATYMTADVYIRIILLILNPITYFMIYEFFMDHFKLSHYYAVLGICLIIGSLLIQGKEIKYQIDSYGTPNPMYRMNNDEVIATSKIEEIMEREKIDAPILATTLYNEFRLVNPHIKMQFTRLNTFIPDENYQAPAYRDIVLHDFITGKVIDPYLEKYGPTIIDIIEKQNIDFVVLNKYCEPRKEGEVIDEWNIYCDPPELYPNRTYYDEAKAQVDLFMQSYEKIFENSKYIIYFTGRRLINES